MEIQEICRVCTAKNAEMLSIFESYNFSTYNCEIFKAITDCTFVQIRKFDGFSEQICPRCLEHLSQAYSFKKLCEDSDYKFRNNMIFNKQIRIKNELQHEEIIVENKCDNEQFRKQEYEEPPDLKQSQCASDTPPGSVFSIAYKSELCSKAEPIKKRMRIHKEQSDNDLITINEIKSEFSMEDTIINYGETRHDFEQNAGETSQMTNVGLSQFKEDEYLEGEELYSLSARKRRSKNRTWTKRHEFQSEKDALTHIEAENTWKKCALNKTLDGEKVEYRCKYGKYRKNECPARLYLLYHATNETVSLYATDCEHDHLDESQRGLDDKIKTLIVNLVHNGIEKPNSLLAAIRNENLMEPPKGKLITFLRQLKHKKHSAPAISGYELKKWCEEKSNLPESKDDAFVLSYRILCESLNEKDQDIKIVVSTLRLLENLSKTELVQIDATHKLSWQGYPIMLIGTSDKNNTFHPFATAVSKAEDEDDFYFIFEALRKYDLNWKPKYLLADGNIAITSGFNKAFGSPEVRLMCYFHVLQAIEKKLRGLGDANEIKSDINSLQNCTNTLMFTKASKLFVEKWRKKKEARIDEFLNYFEGEYLEVHPNWYEGAASGYPSTNNGMEAIHEVIKKEHSLRERLPVSQFLNKLHELLFNWSKDYDPAALNQKQFALRPAVNLKDWTDAYHWSLLNKNILSVEDRYYTCSSGSGSNNKNITSELLQQYQRLNGNWKTFEEFNDFHFSIWGIKVKPDLQECSCTCPKFSKNYKCKHVLGLQIRLRLTEVPEEAKRIPLNQKRKRGRPSKAKVLILE